MLTCPWSSAIWLPTFAGTSTGLTSGERRLCWLACTICLWKGWVCWCGIRRRSWRRCRTPSSNSRWHNSNSQITRLGLNKSGNPKSRILDWTQSRLSGSSKVLTSQSWMHSRQDLSKPCWEITTISRRRTLWMWPSSCKTSNFKRMCQRFARLFKMMVLARFLRMLKCSRFTD